MIDVILPELTGNSSSDLERIRRYLLSFKSELEGVLSSLGEDNLLPDVAKKLKAPEKELKSLKQAVINSATYIKSVEEKLSATLKNEYVAVSDIGEYTSNAIGEYTVDGKGIDQLFTLTERVGDSVASITGYIRTGVLDDGEIGLEIGDFSGASPFKVRLVDNRLSFFANGDEVAYVSDSTLYITKAHVTGTLILGSYHVDLSQGLAFKFMEGVQ